MGAIDRNNVQLAGNPAGPPMLFAHGFGCDQHMWRFVAPAFGDEYRLVLFDLVGAGGSDLSAFDPDKYATLGGYASDVLEICDELELRDVTFVGHSVSSMIGMLAAASRPELFRQLVLVAPSPRYLDDEGYEGGFERADIDGLLEALDSNFLGWAGALAPAIIGNADRPELGEELTNSFCRTDPTIARHFAGVTFLSDNRDDLARVRTPTLILQCSDDLLAPPSVGAFMCDGIEGSTLVQLRATGHCPNLSAPDEVVAAMREAL